MSEKRLGKEQYQDSSRFNARVYLNHKFRTNKYLWPLWVFDQFEKPESCRVLELGSGTGILWTVNAERIPGKWEVILSDYSQGMLDEACKNLSAIGREFEYKIINAEDIKMPDESFDIVIANHMLYHMSDREKALSEIKRVLKEDGVFYASTASVMNSHELWKLMKEFKHIHNQDSDLESVVQNFSLENGEEQLKKVFTDVELRNYANSLEITEVDAIVNYFLSLNDIKDGEVSLEESRVPEFREFIMEKMKLSGKISATSNSGMFICRK